MVSTLCDRIREENKQKYGTHVSVYGPVLLANLYSDRTHFLYELLQNAEDACERARKKGQKGKFYISFKLYPNRLEVRHNGIPFDEKDVKGICGIVEATKDKDTLQIGKFGIGFKSVYAFTTSPEVHSEKTICHSCIKCAFRIQDYVHPYPINLREDVRAGETLFVMRFDKEVREVAYSEIESRLRNLGIRTLLFLNNLEEVSYKTESTAGKYLRCSETVNGARQVSLHYVEEEEKQTEKWLILDKSLSKDKSRKMEIAFLLANDSQSRSGRIIPATNVKLFAYFSTQKETHLKFLIQGPYNTTPARDNIRNDEWNRELIEETATLVSESISKIKALNLLDVEFLRTLPIDTDHFTQESTVFKPIYGEVKEKLLSDEALLPAYDRSFTVASKALIARGKGLHSFLTGEHLDTLFERKGSKWLDENITEDRTPELRRYLMNELEIEEVDPELFARKFNLEFISKQSDKWVSSFYSFLLTQKALWRASTHYERPGLLRFKPIIRLNDNSHTPPFDDDERPIVYLPHKDPNTRRLFPKTVKDTIVHDKKAREFLKALGINEPDKVTAILNLVLPKYEETTAVSEEDNLRHFEWILKTLEECEGTRRDKLLRELRETPFLCAENASNQQKEYKKPKEIHLGEAYTGRKESQIYFDGNQEIWFLDERYLAFKSAKGTREKLKEMGCNPAIQVRCRKPDYLNHVTIIDNWGDHRRGLDGFDPDCEVEGLEHALQNITAERSRILWHIAKKHCQSIYGEVESSTKQYYEGSTRLLKFSKMGKLLAEYSWLPSHASSSFYKPSKIMLSELPVDFDKESPEAKSAASKLRFKPELDRGIRGLIESTPDEAREILQIFMTASPEIQQRILESARQIKMSKTEFKGIGGTEGTGITISVAPSPSELEDEFKRSLTQERPLSTSTENKMWTGPTPEEEQKMREYEREIIAKLLKKPHHIERRHKKGSIIKTKREEESMLREFLLEQYKGHCQVCNEKLDLGPDKDPYFEIYRVIKKHRLYGEWSNQEFNVLCLCPNCHALVSYGGRDLQELFNKAKRVADGEEVREEVDERGGDFYITPITIASKQKELFHTSFHMAKISAFVKIIEHKTHNDAHTLAEEASVYVSTVSEPEPAIYSTESDSGTCKGCVCLTCPEKGVYEECGPCPCFGFPENPSKTTACYLRKNV